MKSDHIPDMGAGAMFPLNGWFLSVYTGYIRSEAGKSFIVKQTEQMAHKYALTALQ